MISVHLVPESYQSLFVIIKMNISLQCCVFLMLNILAALCTVPEIISKSVCEGDSVEIFQNISSDRINMKITLYKNNTWRDEAIAIWFVKHFKIEEQVQDRYKPKVSFKNGIIKLRNIESTDEATYTLVCGNDNSSEIIKTHISTLAAPSKYCKPKIRREENILIAFLDNHTNCGNRIVSVQWMEYPGIYYKDKDVIEVPPGKDAYTYYACIEGEVLMCARNSTKMKYCEQIIVGGENIPIKTSDIHQLQTTTVVTAVIVALVLLILVAIPIIMWTSSRIRRQKHQSAPSEGETTALNPVGHDPSQEHNTETVTLDEDGNANDA